MSWASVARGDRRTSPGAALPVSAPPVVPAPPVRERAQQQPQQQPPQPAHLLAGASPAAWPMLGQTAEEAARIARPATLVRATPQLAQASQAATVQPAAQPAARARAQPRPFAWGRPDPPQVSTPTPSVPPLSPLQLQAVLPSAPQTPPDSATEAREGKADISLQRAQTSQLYYVRAFQENPGAFVQSYYVSMSFQQAVVSAGLVLEPSSDPAHPQLTNTMAQVFDNAPFFSAQLTPLSAPIWLPSDGTTAAMHSPRSAPPSVPSPTGHGQLHHGHHNHSRRSHGSGRPRHGGDRSNGGYMAHAQQHPHQIPFNPSYSPQAQPHFNPNQQYAAHLVWHAPPPTVQPSGIPRRVTSRSEYPLPTVPDVPEPDDRIFSIIETSCMGTLPNIMPPESENFRRHKLHCHMIKVVTNEWEGASVQLFGSSGNGLALTNGDVDMVLMVPIGAKRLFRGKPVSSNSNTANSITQDRVQHELQVIKRMADLLRRNKMHNVQDLSRARVPILKMFDPISRFNIDIAVNNELVSHNTDLLAAYCELDKRVRPLCLLVKFWAKQREVNNTYRGTLSSYAYVLMVINFLQTRSEPVLPCLQRMVEGKELKDDSKLPLRIVSHSDRFSDAPIEYNVYFDRSNPTWFSKNKTSVGILLLEFFKYYAYEFDYNSFVVSIRTGKVLRREIKKWDVNSVQLDAEAAEEEFHLEQALGEREKIEWEQRRDEALRRFNEEQELAKQQESTAHEDSSGESRQVNGTSDVSVENESKAEPVSDPSRVLPVSPPPAEPDAHPASLKVPLQTPAPKKSTSTKSNSLRSQNSLQSTKEGDSTLSSGVAQLSLRHPPANGDAARTLGDRGESVSSSVTSADASPSVSTPRSPQQPGSPRSRGQPSGRPRMPNSSGAAAVPDLPPPPIARLSAPRRVERHLFCIEDPFNLTHDLSRAVDEQTLLVIRQELVRAHSILGATGSYFNLCQPFHPPPGASAVISPVPVAAPVSPATSVGNPAVAHVNARQMNVPMNHRAPNSHAGTSRSGSSHSSGRQSSGKQSSGRHGGSSGVHGGRARQHSNKQGHAQRQNTASGRARAGPSSSSSSGSGPTGRAQQQQQQQQR